MDDHIIYFSILKYIPFPVLTKTTTTSMLFNILKEFSFSTYIQESSLINKNFPFSNPFSNIHNKKTQTHTIICIVGIYDKNIFLVLFFSTFPFPFNTST